METLSNSDTPTLVSNIEVMKILSERIANREKDDKSGSRRKQSPQLQHRDWIEEKVLEYIQTTPCANVDIKRMPSLIAALRGKKKAGSLKTAKNKKKTQKDDNTNGEGFGLTDGETVQILNFMPQESVEIHLMIEELHSRMSDERQEELLQLVGSYAAGDATGDDQAMEDAYDGAILENGHIDTERKKMDAQKINGDKPMDTMKSSDVVMKEEPP